MRRTFKLMFAVFAALLMAAPALRAADLTVYDSTLVSVYVPLPTCDYNQQGTRGQVIYPAEALTAMVGQSINGFTLYINDEGCKMNGGLLRVSVAEVDYTVFPSTTFYTNVTAVAGVEMKAGLREVDIYFDTPYTYNGGNLLIDFYVQVAGQSEAYNFTYFYGVYQPGHTCITTGSEGNEYREFIPKTTFNYGPLADYSAKVNPRFVDFNTIRVGESDTAVVTLKNNGLNPFTPSVSADAPFVASIPAGLTLMPGETAEVTVVFKPTAAGEFQGNLRIDCGEAGILEVPLTGTALENGVELIVCDGDARNQYVPINGIYVDDVNTKGQMIYPAEKLVQMKDGKIVAMTFFTASSINMRNAVLQLSLATTDQTEFDQATPLTGLTAVGTAAIVQGDTTITFDFDTPFDYSGGNLAVEVKVASTGWTSTTFFLGEATDYYASLSCYKSWSGDKKDRYQFLPKASFCYQGGTQPAVRGDVDGDSVVDINDVTALINIVLKGLPATEGANCDLQGTVDINDVTALINFVLTGTWRD